MSCGWKEKETSGLGAICVINKTISFRCDGNSDGSGKACLFAFQLHAEAESLTDFTQPLYVLYYL